MTPHPNTARLFRIMKEESLNRVQVAEMLNVTPKTVSCWRCESPRWIGDRVLEVLELRLQLIKLEQELEATKAERRTRRGRIAQAAAANQ